MPFRRRTIYIIIAVSCFFIALMAVPVGLGLKGVFIVETVAAVFAVLCIVFFYLAYRESHK